MDKPKLIRLEFEYDDGSIQRLTGEEAHRWFREANAAVTISTIHGAPFPGDFQWEWVRKPNEQPR